MLVNILGNLDRISLGVYIGTELGSLDESFDGYNDGNLKGLLFGDSLGSTYGKVLGSDEGIKLGYTDGEVLVTILVDVDGTTLGIDV